APTSPASATASAASTPSPSAPSSPATPGPLAPPAPRTPRHHPSTHPACPERARSYCMNVPAMLLGLHERGIHVVSLRSGWCRGGGSASRAEVSPRCPGGFMIVASFGQIAPVSGHDHGLARGSPASGTSASRAPVPPGACPPRRGLGTKPKL